MPELLVCGDKRVFNITWDMDPLQHSSSFTWDAAGDSDLPENLRDTFNTTDECKPVDEGRRILITSSGGGIALIDRETGVSGFYGFGKNAHSAAIVPGGYIAVAISHVPNGDGDCLQVYHEEEPGIVCEKHPLPHGHGCFWDDATETLMALGNQIIKGLKKGKGNSILELEWSVDLPESGGHDFYPIPGTRQLTVTTSRHCWVFDCDSHVIEPYPELADIIQVKCISINAETGQIAYIQAEPPNWWASRIHLKNPHGVIILEGERLYKARWA